MGGVDKNISGLLHATNQVSTAKTWYQCPHYATLLPCSRGGVQCGSTGYHIRVPGYKPVPAGKHPIRSRYLGHVTGYQPISCKLKHFTWGFSEEYYSEFCRTLFIR
eukprot:sb/3477868/